MLLTAQQVRERLGIGETSLKNLVKSGTLKPVNERKPDAKKYFMKFGSKEVDEVRREMRANGKTIRPPRERMLETVPESPSNRLERIEAKLDQLLSMWK